MEPYPWEKNESHYVVKSSLEWVMMNKRFKAPLTTYYKQIVSAEDRFHYYIQPNLDFWLRFYFPQDVINVNTKAKRLIIMYNGLDEILDKHFDVYDQLGSSFASRGIASVLFPTPFHLNRAARLKSGHETDQDGTPRPKLKVPSYELLKNPFYVYMNFIQTLHEYVLFTSFLSRKFVNCRFDKLPDYDPPDEADLHFYDYFGEEIEISLLGYSLGGLKALMCFRSNPDHVKSCVLLNSGAAVDKINLKGMMEKPLWQSITDSIVSEQYPSATLQSLIDRQEYPPVRDAHQKRVLDLLRNVRNDDNYAEIRKVLVAIRPFNERERELLGRKLVLVIGGRDKIIPPAEIQRLEPEGSSLNILQISDLGHFPDDDSAFNRWYRLIVNMLVGFIEEPEGMPLSKSQVLALLIAYDWICDCDLLTKTSFRLDKARALVYSKLDALGIDDDMQHMAVRGLKQSIDIATLRFHVQEQEILIKELMKYKRRQGLRFGDIVAGLPGFDETEQRQIEATIASKPTGKKTGEVLANEEYITKRYINIVLRKQGQKYMEILDEIPEGKKWLSPVFRVALEALAARARDSR